MIANRIRQHLTGHTETVSVPRELLVSALDVLEQVEAASQDELTGPYMSDGQHCTPKERKVLAELLKAEGKSVTNRRLLSCSQIVSNEALWVHIVRLRKKLRSGCDIQTINTVGYMLTVKGDNHDASQH